MSQLAGRKPIPWAADHCSEWCVWAPQHCPPCCWLAACRLEENFHPFSSEEEQRVNLAPFLDLLALADRWAVSNPVCVQEQVAWTFPVPLQRAGTGHMCRR